MVSSFYIHVVVTITHHFKLHFTNMSLSMGRTQFVLQWFSNDLLTQGSQQELNVCCKYGVSIFPADLVALFIFPHMNDGHDSCVRIMRDKNLIPYRPRLPSGG